MQRTEFWKDKRVFVTGHTGFKGSWLCIWLQMMGAKVTGYALTPPTDPSLFSIASVETRMHSIHGDVRDYAAVERALRESQAEIVIHMAAQPIVRESYDDPITTYAANVLGTAHVLQAVRKVSGIKAVVMVTSDKCYENREWFWSYREKSQLGGDDPYSSSKACAELVISSFRKSYFNPKAYAEHGIAIASARAGNVVGGGDWARDRLVPDTMRSLLISKPIQVRNPHATRPWQHVLEPLNGYLVLARHLYEDGPNYASAWNFGPFEFNDKNVGWVVTELYRLWGAEYPWERDTKTNPHENTYLKLDSSKARALLGWAPKLDLNTTLRWIVGWFKSYQSRADMRALTESQIFDFMERKPFEPLTTSQPAAAEELV